MVNKGFLVVLSAVFVLAVGVSAQGAVDMKALEEKLSKAATYDYGQSREVLTEIADIAKASYEKPEELKQIETQFDKFLASDATLASKQFICRQLSIIGTDQSVPVLSGMLLKADTSNMARYALERIPGETVNEALRNALGKTEGLPKIGVINTLGMRGDRKAVSQLAKLTDSRDAQVASAAVAALGHIASPEAAKALAGAKGKARGTLKDQVLDAYLKCADEYVARGERPQALKIYEELYEPMESAAIRSAALAGLIKTSDDKAAKVIVNVLKGDDPQMQMIAISMAREIKDKEVARTLAGQLGNLQPAAQVQLISSLADIGDSAALPAVVVQAKSDSEAVRIAALDAIKYLGDESMVGMLAQAAAAARRQEQQTARQSLYRLKGEKVDATIIESIPAADEKVKIELVTAVDERKIKAAKDTLFKAAKDDSVRVRVASIKVLKNITSVGDLPALVGLLAAAQSETERREAETTIVAVSQQTNPEAGAKAALAAMERAEDAKTRGALLSVLGKIGDTSAIPTLRAALKDSDADIQAAAIRALSEWPNAEPASDLLKIAETSANTTHKVLALRGYVGLIARGKDISNADKVAMYKKAMELAPNDSEKKMVLSGLSSTKSAESLAMAVSYLDNEALAQEAASAIVSISEETSRTNPKETREALQKAAEVAKSPTLKRKTQQALSRVAR